MLRVWRSDRCLSDASAGVYLQWIKRFRRYCIQHGLQEGSELTRDGARRFVAWYARRRGLDQRRLPLAGSALRALHRVHEVMGLPVPAWQQPQPASRPASALLCAYADHLAHQRGNPDNSVRKMLAHVGMLLQHLAGSGKTWRHLALPDIDAFLIDCSRRYARTTTAGIACSVRSFARFLRVSGRLDVDLAEAVVAPVQRKDERLRPTLPWQDVQRLLRAIDTSTARGLRDHALLLMMSTYGLGAGEVTGLELHDIDWEAATVKVTRPKTGVSFVLPLLPAVARVLARYLRHSRPPHAPTRHLFVAMRTPFGALSGSSPVRHILARHARAAGIEAPFLGSHVLRHANAARQLDAGTPPQVLSGLLGHRDGASVSAYVRIATQSLREVSLPVPR
ncbi:site-specific integrase [Azohydromonas aeria]|uniref:site-specific integrase n=1 Tax=Azohydromonas aeria TaxID=2590212 RepID=UPI001E37A721|nr:site-specific integrase [Azohydromonas aeria]